MRHRDAGRSHRLGIAAHGPTLTVRGIAVGLIGSDLAIRALAALLFGVGLRDPATFPIVAAMFVIVAALASCLPSRRATRIGPVVALRAE